MGTNNSKIDYEAEEKKITAVKNVRQFEAFLRQLAFTLEDGGNGDEFFTSRAINVEDAKQVVTADFLNVEEAWQYKNRFLLKCFVGTENGGDGKVWISLIEIDGNWKIYELVNCEKPRVQLVVDAYLGVGLERDLRSMMSGGVLG